MTADGMVAVVVPVYRNAATLPALVERLADSLAGREWRLRLVVDACPAGSLAVAERLARGESRIAVTLLPVNQGQHLALARGLADEPDASAWVCIDADLQDPPEVVPALLDHLAGGRVDCVFAGRRGRYESRTRLATGRAHRAVMARLTSVPADAGAFVALGPAGRDAVVRLRAPSIVAAIGAAGVAATSIPVERAPRPSGSSAWTSGARLRQSLRTLLWARRHRTTPATGTRVRRGGDLGRPALDEGVGVSAVEAAFLGDP